MLRVEHMEENKINWKPLVLFLIRAIAAAFLGFVAAVFVGEVFSSGTYGFVAGVAGLWIGWTFSKKITDQM